MAKGRPPVTGRFATRGELVDFVWGAYLGTTRTYFVIDTHGFKFCCYFCAIIRIQAAE